MDARMFYHQRLDEQIDVCVIDTHRQVAELLGRPDIKNMKDPQEFAKALMDEMDLKGPGSDAEGHRLLRKHGVNFSRADAFRHVRNDVMHREGKYTQDEQSFQQGLKIIEQLSTGIAKAHDEYSRRPGPDPQDSSRRPEPNPRDSSRRPGAVHQPAGHANKRHKKFWRLAYFAAVMTVVCVVGLLIGGAVTSIGFSDKMGNFVWLGTCALAINIIMGKFDWRGTRALMVKYCAIVVFWFALGLVASEAIAHFTGNSPGNVSTVPALVIWALGAILVLRNMISDGKLATRRR